ncbi:MAG: hypothetical protein ACK4OO_02540 [bacterium]
MRRGPTFRRYTDYALFTLGLLAVLVGLGSLIFLMVDVGIDGLGRINSQFLTSYSS